MLRLTFSRFARPLTRIFDQFQQNLFVIAARVALKDSIRRVSRSVKFLRWCVFPNFVSSDFRILLWFESYRLRIGKWRRDSARLRPFPFPKRKSNRIFFVVNCNGCAKISSNDRTTSCRVMRMDLNYLRRDSKMICWNSSVRSVELDFHDVYLPSELFSVDERSNAVGCAWRELKTND